MTAPWTRGTPALHGRDLAKWVPGIVLFGMALAIALWAPLFNGFPLVYWDTGTYLRSSFELTVPPDRPVFYGLWLASLRLLGTSSLWGPVVAQVAVALGLAAACLRAAGRPLWLLLPLACLSNGTWYWGQVMPDAWSGGVAVCLGLLLAGALHGAVGRTLVWLCLVVSVAMHYSHGLIAVLVLAAVGSWAVASKRWAALRRRWVTTSLAVVTGFALVLAVNATMTGRVFFSESASVFYTGRLIQSGLLTRFLEEQCGAGEAYALCGEAAYFRDHGAYDFLWDEATSPLYRHLGGWEGAGPRLAPLVRKALTAYPRENLVMAVQGTLTQLTLLGTGDGTQKPYGEGTMVYRQVRQHLPGQFGAFQESRLQQGRLWPVVARLRRPYNVLAVAGLLIAFLRWRAVALALMLFFVSSAAVTGALSYPIERMQGRLLWLPVLAALLALGRRSRP